MVPGKISLTLEQFYLLLLIKNYSALDMKPFCVSPFTLAHLFL